MTLAIAAGVPGIRRVIDALIGLASVTNLIVHLLILGAAASLIEFVHQTTGDNVIEIRDAALAVGAHEDREDREMRARARELLASGGGLSGEPLAAAVEAVALRCAVLRTARAGRADGAAALDGRPTAGPGHDDLEAEVAWLERVAGHFGTARVQAAAEEVAAALG